MKRPVVGNDIVALDRAVHLKRSDNPRALRKLFTDAEIAMIHEADHPEIEVWRLWALKESAYKCWIKEGGHRGFYPKEISVLNSANPLTASIRIFDQIYFGKVFFEMDYILAHASNEIGGLARLVNYSGKNTIADSPSHSPYLKQKLIKFVADRWGREANHFSVEKDDCGIPYLCDRGQRLAVDVSISHDFPYGAFCLLE